jgi:hypothetical protein
VGKEGLHDGRVLHNRDDLQPAPTAGTATGHGPVQSNGMCLLEFVVHWNL